MLVAARVSLLLVTLCPIAGCPGSSDQPQLSNLTCTPASLSVGGGAPHSVTCSVDFEGKVGDCDWTAIASDGTTWAGEFMSLDPSEWDGRLDVALVRDTAPPLGQLVIRLLVDHIDGIDGPGGDEIETRIDVVP